jgi:hypothetical protein
MSTTTQLGCLTRILLFLVLGVAAVYLVTAITSPWAFHIGGRYTPLLHWTGYGRLIARNGTYPLYVSFFPSSSFSHLHMDGLRPTGGVRGAGTLCTAPGIFEPLRFSGTIFGGWSTTEGSLMAIRLVETRPSVSGTERLGSFGLYGRWRGQELVMEDRGQPASPFRSGLKIEHASVTLDWGSEAEFKRMCAGADSGTR